MVVAAAEAVKEALIALLSVAAEVWLLVTVAVITYRSSR